MTANRWKLRWLGWGLLLGLAHPAGWAIHDAKGETPSRTPQSWGLMIYQAPTQPLSLERRSLEKKFPFGEAGQIVIENPRGRILIKEGAPGQVRLVADGGLVSVLPDDLTIKPKKSELSIKVPPTGRQPTLDLSLEVPPDVRLKLKTEEGTVQVHGRVRGVRVETLSGDIVLNLPMDDLKIEILWRESYVRYAGPELQRSAAPPPLSPPRGHVPPPTVMSGQIGQGRVSLNVSTLSGWVEIGPPRSKGALTGMAPAQPLSQAAEALARHRESILGSAIRAIEPRLERVFEASNGVTTSQPPIEEEDVVKLESSLVNLNVSVTNAEGKVMGGLTVDDFTVFEDGVRQPISHFATEATPFNLILLLDVSGSIAGKIELVQQAAMRFVDLMHPDDKLAVLLFARDVEVVAPLTNDRDRLRQAIDRARMPHGSTALYDAIGYAMIEGFRDVPGQRNAVVVITDGQDSSLAYVGTPLANDPLRRPGSFLRFNDLLSGVLVADTLIYPIVVGGESNLANLPDESARQQLEALRRQAQEQLRQLADASGGRVYRAAQIQGVEDAYEQIATDLRTIYSLAYTPGLSDCDGCWRPVAVKVARPDARVRCRQGYLAR